MGDPLRDRQSVKNLAADEQLVEIAAKVSDFGALSQAVAADLAELPADEVPAGWKDRPVTGTIRFGFVDAGERVAGVEGTVETRIDAVCQRCLATFELPVEATFAYAFTVPASAENSAPENVVPEDMAPEREAWELVDGNVVPIDVVDETLVMALPFAAVHDEGDDCIELEQGPEAGEGMTRPFASLRAQMDDTKQD